MENQAIYGKGHNYEMFLRYAFKLNQRSFKKRADRSIYENLFHIEKGVMFVKRPLSGSPKLVRTGPQLSCSHNIQS